MDKHRQKLILRGIWGTVKTTSGYRGRCPGKLTGYIAERVTFVIILILEGLLKMNFRLFCSFLTIPLRTNYNFNVHDYPDRSHADERMVMLLYTLHNFDNESDNRIHV